MTTLQTGSTANGGKRPGGFWEWLARQPVPATMGVALLMVAALVLVFSALANALFGLGGGLGLVIAGGVFTALCRVPILCVFAAPLGVVLFALGILPLTGSLIASYIAIAVQLVASIWLTAIAIDLRTGVNPYKDE